MVGGGIKFLFLLALLRDPSRCAARRARVAGLVARGGQTAAPTPQLTRNGAK